MHSFFHSHSFCLILGKHVTHSIHGLRINQGGLGYLKLLQSSFRLFLNPQCFTKLDKEVRELSLYGVLKECAGLGNIYIALIWCANSNLFDSLGNVLL